MLTLKPVRSCGCQQCKQMLASIRKATAKGWEVAIDVGGHGSRLCREYKGHTYGLDCGCYSHRKRIHRVRDYGERKEASE